MCPALRQGLSFTRGSSRPYCPCFQWQVNAVLSAPSRSLTAQTAQGQLLLNKWWLLSAVGWAADSPGHSPFTRHRFAYLLSACELQSAALTIKHSQEEWFLFEEPQSLPNVLKYIHWLLESAPREFILGPFWLFLSEVHLLTKAEDTLADF